MTAERKPNIVLIMTDEMRGDAMGVAGHPDVKTPHLDTLADTGVYFPRAYSACPSCIAARATLMTGMTPAHTGRVGYQDGRSWNYAHTLAGELSANGYYTQCVGKMHVHPLRKTLGFHNVELHDGYLHYYRRDDAPTYAYQPLVDDYYHWLKREMHVDYDANDTGLDCNSWVTRPWPYDERLHPTNWVTSRCLDFLRRRDREKPFFLMASYVRPHAPFDAPQTFFDMYKDKPLRPPFRGDWDDEARIRKVGRVYNNTTGPIDPEQIRRQQAGYYACVTHVDYEIGRLLIALGETGERENTVILFTSDHGEMLSDHMCSRKTLPYEGSARIPMILSGPERLIGPARRDERLAELMDVMPTLMDIAGAETPETVDGTSLLAPAARAWLHGEHVMEKGSMQYIVTERDKYVWYSKTMEEQYFDLADDPHEAENRIGSAAYGERIAELRAILIAELAGREEGYTDGTRLLPVASPKPTLSTLPD